MSEKLSYEEQVQHFNAIMTQTVNLAPAPLQLDNIELRILSLHRNLQKSGVKIPEHEHPNYEFSFMNIGSMVTYLDKSHVICETSNKQILFIPPLTLHHRTFGDNDVNINQSMVLTIVGINDEGKLRCMELSELIDSMKYCFRLTPELNGLQKEIEHQLDINKPLIPIIIMNLLYAFISIFFQQNFPELFNASCKGQLIFKPDRVDAIKKLVLNLMNRKESLSYFEQRFDISARHLNRIFKQETGFSIKKYQALQKLAQAKELLCSSISSIAEISHSLGFRDQVRFSSFFKKYQGCSPSHFRNTNKNNPDRK